MEMEPYISKSGKPSGVTGFELGEKSIRVEFGIWKYHYTYASCGAVHVENMKSRALASLGLSTYIAQRKPKHVV
jgi:hypothetical protein